MTVRLVAGRRPILLAAVCVLLAGCAASPPPNVVIITLDTTRADHLACYGYPRPTTPRIDELASEGTVFDRCLSPVPVTLPSHATIFTGTYPTFHGVRDNAGFELPEQMTTLAEVLNGRGYSTAAFIGAFPLDSRFKLDQGFRVYDDDVRPPSGDSLGRAPADQLFYEERKADDVTEAALTWLDDNSGGPFFIWLHYFDPHMPYNAPDPFNELFAESPYAAEIAFTDDNVGRFVDVLRKERLIDHTLVVVVGDHGEGLGDHGELTHGLTIYDSILRVPLIIRVPGQAPGRIPSAVQTIDVMPTVCELVGVEIPPEVQGSSLVAQMGGGASPERDSYFESLRGRLQYGWSPIFGLGQGEWKFIAAPEPELFNVARDPGETHNLIDRHSDVARDLESRLTLLREEIRSPGASAAAVWIDSATRDRLAALGYLGGDGVDRVEIDAIETVVPGMVNPHRGVPELMGRIIEVRNLVASGKPHRALDILGTVLQLDPANPEALYLEFIAHSALHHRPEALASARAYAEIDQGSPRAYIALGMALLALDRPEEAVEHFQRAADVNPNETGAFNALCFALTRLDRRLDAEIACRQAIDLDPDGFDARSTRANLLARERRFDEALADLDRLIDRFSEVADLHHRRGVVLMELGRDEEAREELEAALQLEPSNSTTLLALGLLERRAGRPQQSRIYLERVVELDPDGVKAAAASSVLGELEIDREDPDLQ